MLIGGLSSNYDDTEEKDSKKEETKTTDKEKREQKKNPKEEKTQQTGKRREKCTSLGLTETKRKLIRFIEGVKERLTLFAIHMFPDLICNFFFLAYNKRKIMTWSARM